MLEKPNINAYLRVRTCHECRKDFNTYEIDEVACRGIEGLVNCIEDIQDRLRNIETFTQEASKNQQIDPKKEADDHATNVSELNDKIIRNLKKEILTLISTLTPREAKVIRLSFGFVSGRCESLEEISRQLGLSKQKIDDILSKSLRKFRHPSRSEKVRHFIDSGAIKVSEKPLPEARLLYAIFGMPDQ